MTPRRDQGFTLVFLAICEDQTICHYPMCQMLIPGGLNPNASCNMAVKKLILERITLPVVKNITEISEGTIICRYAIMKLTQSMHGISYLSRIIYILLQTL